MNKEAQIKMSMIPLVLILAVILGAGYLLIQGDIELPSFDKKPQIKRLEGFPTVIYTDEDMEKERRVIQNQDELVEFLNKIDKTGLTIVREPVDYDQEFLLGASSESELAVGHKLKIKKAYMDKEKNELKVIVEETFPDESCEIEEDKHVAVDLVSISKTDAKIAFDKVQKVERCD